MPTYRVEARITEIRAIEVSAEDQRTAREIMWRQLTDDESRRAIVSSRELYGAIMPR